MTAQFSDSIMYNGELFGIACEPFEEFLKTRPDIKYVGYCSACWRGYTADWKIMDNKLYLIGLNEFQFGDEESIKKEKSYNFIDIFPNQDKVLADWYSGEIKIQQGEVLKYVHACYASIYEKEVILDIKEGVVLSEREVDNRGKVFEDDTDIKRMLKDLKKPSWGQRVRMYFLKRGKNN